MNKVLQMCDAISVWRVRVPRIVDKYQSGRK